MEFNKRLKELREEIGLSQSELGEKLGLSQSQVGNMEIGKRMPSIEVAIQISNFFCVSLDYLFGDAPTREGHKVDKSGFKIKTPAELADVGVESVVKLNSEPLTPTELAAIRKILGENNG